MISDGIYTSPESKGVSSRAILDFIDFSEKNRINLHSFMFAVDGEIIAEGYCPPFDSEFLHRLYSATKTYVAVAIGMLVTEGRVRITDRILDYFPEYDTDDVPQLMRECTVEDALTMSTPQYIVTRQSEKGEILPNPFIIGCDKPGGTVFNYGNGTELCVLLCERLSGMRLDDYLRPLFDKLGISKNVYCLLNNDGSSWGASGMISTMRDFAKFAEFVGRRGECRGEQLVDREYMERMTSFRTNSKICLNSFAELYSSGYGYFTWITPDAVCMRGMGCQQAYYFAERDLLFVCNGDTMTDADFADARIYDAVKHLVYYTMGEPTLPGDAYKALSEKLTSLHLPRYGSTHSDMAARITGKTYYLTPNAAKWSFFRLDFSDGEGTLSYKNARGEKALRFGLGSYLKFGFPETHYYDRQRGVPSGRELDALGIAEWVDEHQLLIRMYITDVSFGSVFILIGFKGDTVGIEMKRRGEFILDDYGGVATGYLKEE